MRLATILLALQMHGFESRNSEWARRTRPPVLPSDKQTASAPGIRTASRLIVWLYAPLPTLRRHPRGCLRWARADVGCDSFIAVGSHHRSPGALSFARLLGFHLTESSSAFSETLITSGIAPSSFRWFEPRSCHSSSRDPLPSLEQHGCSTWYHMITPSSRLRGARSPAYRSAAIWKRSQYPWLASRISRTASISSRDGGNPFMISTCRRWITRAPCVVLFGSHDVRFPKLVVECLCHEETALALSHQTSKSPFKKGVFVIFVSPAS